MSTANEALRDVLRDKVAINSEEKSTCLNMVNNVSLFTCAAIKRVEFQYAIFQFVIVRLIEAMKVVDPVFRKLYKVDSSSIRHACISKKKFYLHSAFTPPALSTMASALLTPASLTLTLSSASTSGRISTGLGSPASSGPSASATQPKSSGIPPLDA